MSFRSWAPFTGAWAIMPRFSFGLQGGTLILQRLLAELGKLIISSSSWRPTGNGGHLAPSGRSRSGHSIPNSSMNATSAHQFHILRFHHPFKLFSLHACENIEVFDKHGGGTAQRSSGVTEPSVVQSSTGCPIVICPTRGLQSGNCMVSARNSRPSKWCPGRVFNSNLSAVTKPRPLATLISI